jgi:hypothetical protein
MLLERDMPLDTFEQGRFSFSEFVRPHGKET